MSYGAGAFMVAVGLILAFGVNAAVDGFNLFIIGLIIAGAGVVALALSAFTANKNSLASKRSTAVTTHPDGSQTVHEQERE